MWLRTLTLAETLEGAPVQLSRRLDADQLLLSHRAYPQLNVVTQQGLTQLLVASPDGASKIG